MAEIYNTTIGQMVDVPDAAVAEYLADPRYLATDPNAKPPKKKTTGPLDPPAPVDPPVETPAT
jgi:hypothetical protein